MQEINSIGKLLLLIGFVLIFIGTVFTIAGKVPWIGRLPGDIFVERKNLTFYFPIATSILISIIVSLLLILFKKQ